MDDATRLEHALLEVCKVIVGQEHLIERLAVALLGEGHVLVQGGLLVRGRVPLAGLVTAPTVSRWTR